MWIYEGTYIELCTDIHMYEDNVQEHINRPRTSERLLTLGIITRTLILSDQIFISVGYNRVDYIIIVKGCKLGRLFAGISYLMRPAVNTVWVYPISYSFYI